MNAINAIIDILNTIRSTSSSKAKMAILKDNANNDLLKNVCEYAYNTVDYTYGVTARTVKGFDGDGKTEYDLFSLLNTLAARRLTGYAALNAVKNFYNCATPAEQEIVMLIIDRDLKIGINTKSLNKIWKGIVPVPNYCRCGVFSAKTNNNIHYPGYIQLKCDGTYREAHVVDGKVSFKTRSGEDYDNPVMAEIMRNLPNGYYTGEFTVGNADDPDMNRSEANGAINSDNPPLDKIHFTVWDYLTDDEYTGKLTTNYADRFSALKTAIGNVNNQLLNVVPTHKVNTPDEALKIVSQWMNKGLEGGVLKAYDMKFKNGTSNQQLKIKLKVDADLRCTGFIKGTPGTKYDGKNKVITFASDDGNIKGQCSGMTDAMVDEVTKNPDKYIGKIMAVEFNDLSKAQGNEFYALSHPAFMCFRDDKDETDTFERICELRDMARNLCSYT